MNSTVTASPPPAAPAAVSPSGSGSDVSDAPPPAVPGARARTGKIARLPWAVRLELNRRLDDGEPADSLLAWLNALPSVRLVLERQFEGRPVTASNLSDWRHGGFADWQRSREARQDLFADVLGQVGEFEASGVPDCYDAAHSYAVVQVLAELAAADRLPAGPGRSRTVLGCAQVLTRLSDANLDRVRRLNKPVKKYWAPAPAPAGGPFHNFTASDLTSC